VAFTYTAISATVTAVMDVLPGGAHTRVAIQNQGNKDVFVNSGTTTPVANNTCIRIEPTELYEFPTPVNEQVNIISSSGTQACIGQTS